MKKYVVKADKSINRNRSKVTCSKLVLDDDEAKSLLLDGWIQDAQDEGYTVDRSGNPIDWDAIGIKNIDAEYSTDAWAVDFDITYPGEKPGACFAVLIDGLDGLRKDTEGSDYIYPEDFGWD